MASRSMHVTNEQATERAIIVAVDHSGTSGLDVESSLDELAELARTAGAVVAARDSA